MADDTPISPETTTAPPHSFPHHTTSASPLHPFIDTSTPAINANAPVELDSTPVSPVARQGSWPAGTKASDANGKNKRVSPDHEAETYEKLSGEKGVGAREVGLIVARQVASYTHADSEASGAVEGKRSRSCGRR